MDDVVHMVNKSNLSKLPFHNRMDFLFPEAGPMPEGAEQAYIDSDDAREMVRFHYLLPWSWLLAVISLVWMVGSIVLDEFCICGFWFQRSGAVVVLASLWVEWLTSRTPIHGALNHNANLIPTKRYVKWRSFFARSSLVSAILGTLVWAYGDFFFGHSCD